MKVAAITCFCLGIAAGIAGHEDLPFKFAVLGMLCLVVSKLERARSRSWQEYEARKQ